MAVDFSTLLGLTESSGGFYGGSYYDELPNLPLDECMGVMATVTQQNWLDGLQETSRQNEALVEATVSAMYSGSTYQMHSIVESAWETFKAKVKKVFEAIRKFLRSIIEKIKLQINKIRMNGHQLYEKYKDSNLIRGKNFKGLEVEGYRFTTNTGLFPNASKYETDDITVLLDELVKGRNLKGSSRGNEVEEIKTETEGIKDFSASDRQCRMAEILTGSTKLNSGTWESDLKKELYGDKVTLKHGTDFTLDSVAALLKDPANLDAILSEYEKVENGVNRSRTAFERSVDEMVKDIQDTREPHRGTEDPKERKENDDADAYVSAALAYKDALLGMTNDAYGVINRVKNIKWNFQKAKIDQAKTIFSKMLSYKEPKNQNNSAGDFDDMVDFDVDL